MGRARITREGKNMHSVSRLAACKKVTKLCLHEQFVKWIFEKSSCRNAEGNELAVEKVIQSGTPSEHITV
jgi:hypothetical protein